MYCQTCFKEFFSSHTLTSIFSFPKIYIFHRQKRAAIMDARTYFWILNSTGKLMTPLRHNQIKLSSSARFAPVYLNANCRQKVSNINGSYFLKYLDVDHFGRIRKKIYGKQENFWGKKFWFVWLSWWDFAYVLSKGYFLFLVGHRYAWKDSERLVEWAVPDEEFSH